MSVWKNMLKSMDEMDICIRIINDYLNVNYFSELEDKYGVKGGSLSSYVKSREKLIKSQYPKIYNLYIDKKKQNKNNLVGVIHKGYSREEKITEQDMDKLPREINYNEFLNFLVKFNTGTLTGKQLVKIANSRGITVLN